jgi:phosphoribosylformylglycinamidine synthase PurS subunit
MILILGGLDTTTHPQNHVSGVSCNLSIKATKYSEDRLTSILFCRTFMATFTVHVTIENKPGISDPEGETILNDLVLKGTHKTVSKIKTAKMLKFTINEKDKKTAESKIQEICDELRIYNPMVSKVAINVFD